MECSQVSASEVPERALTRPGVVFHVLEQLSHPFPGAEPVYQVDQVQVGQLAVETLHLDVEVGDGGICYLQVYGGLDGTSPRWQVAVVLLSKIYVFQRLFMTFLHN